MPSTNQGFMQRYAQSDPVRPKFRTHFTFCLPFALSTAAAVNQGGAEQIFNLNSLFNPDRTSSNHQPYGFDQMVPALYERFIVSRCAVELRCSTQANTKVCALAASVQPSNAVYALAGQQLSAVVEKSMDTVLFLDADGTTKTRAFTFAIAKIEGLSPIQYQAELDDYSGSSSADPSKTPFLRVAAFNMQDATSATVNCCVILRMDAELYQRKVLAQS